MCIRHSEIFQDVFWCRLQCVKRALIRSFSGPYFPAFGLNLSLFSPSAENTNQEKSEYGNFSWSVCLFNLRPVPKENIRDNRFLNNGSLSPKDYRLRTVTVGFRDKPMNMLQGIIYGKYSSILNKLFLSKNSTKVQL